MIQIYSPIGRLLMTYSFYLTVFYSILLYSNVFFLFYCVLLYSIRFYCILFHMYCILLYPTLLSRIYLYLLQFEGHSNFSRVKNSIRDAQTPQPVWTSITDMKSVNKIHFSCTQKLSSFLLYSCFKQISNTIKVSESSWLISASMPEPCWDYHIYN